MDPGVRRDDERAGRRVEDAQDQGHAAAAWPAGQTEKAVALINHAVVPAQAGTHFDFASCPDIQGNSRIKMDPGVRRDDERTCRLVEDKQDQGLPPPPLRGQPAKRKKRKY